MIGQMMIWSRSAVAANSHIPALRGITILRNKKNMKKILIAIILLVYLQSCRTPSETQACGSSIYTHYKFKKIHR